MGEVKNLRSNKNRDLQDPAQVQRHRPPLGNPTRYLQTESRITPREQETTVERGTESGARVSLTGLWQVLERGGHAAESAPSWAGDAAAKTRSPNEAAQSHAS